MVHWKLRWAITVSLAGAIQGNSNTMKTHDLVFTFPQRTYRRRFHSHQRSERPMDLHRNDSAQWLVDDIDLLRAA